MNCIESQDLLQRRLDGESVLDTAALQRHLAVCADCRRLHAAAGRLEEGLKLLPRLTAPPELAANLAARVLAERRSRQQLRRLRMTSVLAASVLLALLVAYPWSPSGKGHWLVRIAHEWFLAQSEQPLPPPEWPSPTNKAPPAMPAPSLRESFAEAGAAVVALTRRTRTETVEQTRLLTDTLPTTVPIKVWEAVPAAPELPMGSVWQETGQRVSAGLEPVTNSAVRAFKMFVRETAPARGP